MTDYFSTITSQLGIPVGLFVVITIWEAIWTGIAMWKSVKNKHLVWFIVFLVINLIGIPEIIYIIIDSNKKRKKKPAATKLKKKK